eukprot:g7327.t1
MCEVCAGPFCRMAPVSYSHSEEFCGTDCSFCCVIGSLLPICMSPENENGSFFSTVCQRIHDLPMTSSTNSAPNLTPYNNDDYREDDDDEDDGNNHLRAAILGVVSFLVFVFVLRRFSICCSKRRPVNETELTPVVTQATSEISSNTSPPQNSTNGEVVVVVAPNGDVDVGLKENKL